MKKTIYKKGITHSGVFHADDVFSAALLMLIFPDIIIERTNSAPVECKDDTIIFDIGMGEFDHHQVNAEIRDNDVKYASFGLLWERFGKDILGNDWKDFDKTFVQKIDIQDNGGTHNLLSETIGAFNPNWNEKNNTDDEFFKAVDFAKTVLLKMIKKVKSEAEATEYIIKKLNESKEEKIVVLDEFVPWQKEICKSKNVLFVIYPSLREGWNAQTVPKEYGEKDSRMLFPEEWLIEPPNGLSFIHPGRFIIAASSLDEAINLCKMTIEKFEK